MMISKDANLECETFTMPLHPVEEKVASYAIDKLKKVNKLESLTKSINYVFPLREEGRVVAYLKISRSHENGAIMEHFVWRMAQLFGCEELFVPTGLIQVAKRVDQLFMVGKKPLEVKEEGVAGTVQFRQEGLHLGSFKGKLDREQVLQASLVAILFGVYDWHNSNIIIDSKEKLKFFDNARAFPNSNGIHVVNCCYTPSFRLGLLSFSSCYQKLTKGDLSLMQRDIEKFRSKMPQFISYLRGDWWQEKLKGVPKEWFHTEQVIESTRTRLSRLEKVLKEGKVKTVTDIICKIYPNYSFFAILYLVQKSYFNRSFTFSENKLREALEGAGSIEIRSAMMYLCELGVNPKEIYERCIHSQKSINELAKGVLSSIRRKNFLARDRRGIHAAREGGVVLFTNFLKESTLELRDYVLEDAHEQFRDHFLSELNRLNVAVLTDPPNSGTWVEVKDSKGYGSYALCHKTDEGELKSYPLDVSSFPGYVRVGNGNLLTFRELPESITFQSGSIIRL